MARAPLVTITMPDERKGAAKEAPLPERIHLVPACSEEFRIANIKGNLPRDLPKLDREIPFHKRLAIVVGFGPSLNDTWHELLNPPDEPHDIFTVSGSHSFLWERGIRPYGHTECDPREHKPKLLRLICPTTRFFIASRSHAKMFEHLRNYDVWMYHTGRMEVEMNFIRGIDPKAAIVPPASMIGLQCVQLCFFLGYRRFRLYGLDCSFPLGKQHAGFHPNSDPVVVQVGLDGAPGQKWCTTYSMLCSLTDFFNIAVMHPAGTFELRGDGLLQTAERISRGKRVAQGTLTTSTNKAA